MSTPVKSRREAEEALRMEHILSVSERLFSEKGLYDTSVADIAKEAEFGVGTLYKYFKDKNTLIQSLLRSRLDAHFDEMEKIMDGPGSPPEVIERLIRGYLSSVERRCAFFVMYFTHFHPGTIDGCCGYRESLDHSFVQRRKQGMLEKMSRVFQAGIDTGRFSPLGSQYLTAALFGMFLSFTFCGHGNLLAEWDTEGMKNAIKKILFDRVLLK
jgi:AcrR family transcriptional regulator